MMAERLTAVVLFSLTRLQALGINRYSMLGSYCTAPITASWATDRVLVVWSCNAHVTVTDLDFYETIGNVHDWPDVTRPQFETYGEKYLSVTWSGWIGANRKNLGEHDGEVCRGALENMNASTLFLHGAKDNILVPVGHGNIKNSTLSIFPDGKYFLQFKFTEKFVSIVDNFLTAST